MTCSPRPRSPLHTHCAPHTALHSYWPQAGLGTDVIAIFTAQPSLDPAFMS